MTHLTTYFTLEELCASATANAHGLKNIPTVQVIVNLTHLASHILDPLRKALGVPIKISSGYRSIQLNKLVGGVSNSQHLTGNAADISIDGDLAKGQRWFNWIAQHCEFDQLIWEHNAKGTYWIHVSFVYGKNRRQRIDNLLKK